MVAVNLSDGVEELHLKKEVERELFQRLLNSFSYATGLFSAITDVAGKCTMKFEKGECEFCQMIKATPEGLARCRQSYARAGEQALKWREPYIFKCHAGLISWVCPFFYRGRHVGNFICGQVSMWQPGEYCSEGVRQLAVELGEDAASLWKAMKQVPVASSVEIQAASDLLFIVTGYVAQSGTEIFDLQHKLRKIGSWIWTENKKQKLSQRLPEGNGERAISSLENRIFAEIRGGNLEQAKKLLEQLVLQIFIQSKGELELIKGRSLEFLSFLTRMATECGVRFGELIRLSDLKLKEVDEADTVEKVVLWQLAVGNAFIELIAQKSSTEGEGVVNRVLSYVRENYADQELSIRELARICYISPAYLGQVFKRSMGYSLTTYINQVRVEQAKQLLSETDQTIEAVAEGVGFKERSYFCKVFKKLTGLSPNEYRKQHLSPLA